MATKYNGSATYVDFVHAGGTANLTGDSRVFTISQEAGEIDVTTRSSTAKEYLTDFPEITAELTSLDTTGTAQAWDTLSLGLEGTIVYAPEGTASGKRKRTLPAIVTTINMESPYDNAVEIQLSWRGTGTITKAVY